MVTQLWNGNCNIIVTEIVILLVKTCHVRAITISGV